MFINDYIFCLIPKGVEQANNLCNSATLKNANEVVRIKGIIVLKKYAMKS